MRQSACIAIVVAMLWQLLASAVNAQSIGIELHNTLMPASGAMAGTSIARPQDFLSSINGNPASLTQYSGTQFTFSGAWAEPTIDMTQTAPLPLVNVAPFGAKSTAPGSPMGNIGVMQDLSPLGLPGRMGLRSPRPPVVRPTFVMCPPRMARTRRCKSLR